METRTGPPDSMSPAEVLDLLPEALLLFDARGVCTHSNGMALARWGHTGLADRAAGEIFAGREEEIARRIGEALGPGPSPAQVSRLPRAEGDIQVLRVRGGVLVIGHPPRLSAGGAGGGTAAPRDLHALRQPLSAIANWAELIRGASEGDVRGWAEKIADAVRRMADLLRPAASGPAGGGEPADPGAAPD
jgi:hypothetical protein